jgi:hypothetical protein
MRFEIVGTVSEIENIAAGRSVRVLPLLNKRCGKARWRKMKGVATVKLEDGSYRLAEVHWYEAHGKGKREFKIKFPFLD